jgi:hypothetical protein
VKKTVLVLTAIERAFYSATIEYQLIDPILKLSSKRKNIKFVFLFLVPVSFYFVRGNIKKSFVEFRKRRKKLIRSIKNKNINAFFVPVLFPVKHRSFYLKKSEIFTFLGANLLPLYIFHLLYRPTFIQARGYPAGLLAFFMKRSKRIGFLFDMRDVYTKKGIEAGVFTEEDVSYRFWDKTEKKMLSAADGIIVTSQPFRNYVVNKIGVNNKICMVKNSVNRRRFFPHKKIREEVRNRLGIKNRFVIVHSGTFSTPRDVGLTARYFKKWKQLKNESFFLIFTANKRKVLEIDSVLLHEHLESNDYRIINPEPEEVPELLRGGDIGLHLESKSLATKYCIAIKDGEYLATRLPVVCTPYLKGIVPLIKKYNCGIITDPDKESGNEKEKYLLGNLKEMKENSSRIVKEVLSLDIAVQHLEECYQRLLQSIS